MAHVEDRWTQPGPTGRRVKSDRHGSGLRWMAVWHEPDGRRRKKSFTTKDAALAHLDAVSHEKRSGTYVSPERGKITVGEWAQTWLAAQTHLKAGGRNTVEGIVRKHITAHWSSWPLGDVERHHVQAWITGLEVAPATTRRIHGTLLKMLQAAVDARRIVENPARGVNLPSGQPREHRYLTVLEVDRLLAAMHPQHQPITRCLAFTGLRLGEAAELRAKDVQLERKRVTVTRSVSLTTGTPVVSTPKTAAGRRDVPLPREVLVDVQAAIHGRAREQLVYPTAQGMQVRKDNYRRAFLIAAAKADLPGVRPHDLRHTAVSLAIASGASVKVVQRMVGHASAAITLDVYAGLFDQDLSIITDRMDTLIAGERARASAPEEPPASG